MIFPDVRISTLERELAEKRDAFLKSEERFYLSLKASIQPVQLIKNNYKKVAAGALGAVLLGKLSAKAAGFVARAKKPGWLSKIIETGVVMGLRATAPVATQAFRLAIKYFFK